VTCSQPTLSFVIPVRNDATRLASCLQSIADAARSAAIPVEMIVVDNDSRDRSAEVARAAGATVVEDPVSSVAELRNRGASLARGEILAFVDADHVLDVDWVAAAVRLFEIERPGGAGASYSPPNPPTWVQRMYDAFRDHRPGVRDVEWLGSGNLAVARDVFTAAGGFDATLATCEDVDLCRKIRTTGHRLISDSRLASVHQGDPATLRAVFFGELWRGRDNLRVSLRPPISASSLPSIVIPIVNLTCAAAVIVALLVGSSLTALSAAGTILGLSGLRASRMLSRLSALTPADPVRALLVALVYETARSLAVTMPAPHHRARVAATTLPAARS
jgi:hypothetical protein